MLFDLKLNLYELVSTYTDLGDTHLLLGYDS